VLRLSDEQWDRIREHFPEEHIPSDRRGRKPIPTRKVLEAVLWILNTGAQWHMLPQCYPNYKTVHRRFQNWCRNEVLRDVMTDLANSLRDEGALDESECFIDATFASAKGGGEEIGPTKRGKGVKIMAIVDRHGLPLAVSTHAANHHEVTLVQLSFDFYMIEAKPENLIGDRAYKKPGQAQNTGRSQTATLRTTLAGGTFLCLDSVATPSPCALGILCREFSWFCAACNHWYPAKAILR